MSSFLDVEHLQQQSYERSKNWATFIEEIAQRENYKEIELDDLESICRDEHDSDDDLASMEDDECNDFSVNLDVLRYPANSTINHKTTLAKDATVAGNDEDHELMDLFNQTLPIINEHNRHLKESGFDKILNTFDKHKIEETVGSWLNRHNTLYGGDATWISPEKMERPHPRSNLDYQYKTKTAYRNYHRHMNDNMDSDDSLQSGETARYIRSSRARAMKNSSSSSTTTMIKTYRMVKSKREALREKYACDKDDDENHLKALRYRRRLSNTEQDYHQHHHNHYEHSGHGLQRSHKHQMYSTPRMCSQKKRVLRKRAISNSCTNTDDASSTDSESYYYDVRHKKMPCCSQHHYTPAHHNKYSTPMLSPPNTVQRSHRSAMQMPSSRSARFYYYSHSLSKSVSSSSSSSSSFTSKRRPKDRKCRFYDDKRPCKRESECRCCNERKLCQDYKHITDTSTEEWYVENCQSPKKRLKTVTYTQQKSHKSKNINTEPLTPLNENDKEVIEKTKSHKKKTANKSKKPEETKKEQPKKKETKVSKSKQNKNVTSTIIEDSFEKQLQMAIEESKKLYEQEQQQLKAKKTETTKEIRETRSNKPLRKTARTRDDDDEGDKDKDMKDLQTNRKRPQIIPKDSEIKEKMPKLLDEEDIFVKPHSRSVLKPLNENKSVEETFIVATQNQLICNSTANNADDQAYKRQFSNTIRQQDEVKGQEEILSYPKAKKTGTRGSNEKFAKSIVEQNINDDNTIKDKKQIETTSSNKQTMEDTANFQIETKEKCDGSENKALKRPQVVDMDDDNKSTNSETEPAKDNHIFKKPHLKSIIKSLKQTKNPKITKTDETLISLSSNKSNDVQDYKKQFAEAINHEDKQLKSQKVNDSKTELKKNLTKSKKTQKKENIINSDDSTNSETEQDINKETQKKKNATKSNVTQKTIKLSTIIDSEDSSDTENKQDFDKETFERPQSKSKTNSVNKSEISTISTTNETFFSPIPNLQAICNSTANPNDTQAYKRQFANSISQEDSTLKLEKDMESKTLKKKNDTKSNKSKEKIKCFKMDDSKDSTDSEQAIDKDNFKKPKMKSVKKSVEKTKVSTITKDTPSCNEELANSLSQEDSTLKLEKDMESKTLKKKNDTKSNKSKEKIKCFKMDDSKDFTDSEQAIDKDNFKKPKMKSVKKSVEKTKVPTKDTPSCNEELANSLSYDKKIMKSGKEKSLHLNKIIDSENSTDSETEQTFKKPQPKSKSKTKSINKTKISTINGTNQVICNSKDKPNDSQPYNRQIGNSLSHDNKSLNLEKVNQSKKNDMNSNNNEIKSNKAQKSESNKKTTSNAVITLSNKNEKSKSNKKTAISTVTSTTIRSPDTNSTNTTTAKTRNEMNYINLDSSSDEHSDCTLVTSTTNIDPPSNRTITTEEPLQPQPSTSLSSSLSSAQQRQDSSNLHRLQSKTLPSNPHHSHRLHQHPQTQKGILIYTPQNRSLAPAHSFSTNGCYFDITKEHLSSIIGLKATEKFLKYYVGRKRFNSNSTIYFKPPSGGVLDTSSSDSNSDDEFSNFEKCGELYESFNKNSDHH